MFKKIQGPNIVTKKPLLQRMNENKENINYNFQKGDKPPKHRLMKEHSFIKGDTDGLKIISV